MYIRRKVFSNTGYGYEPVENVYNVTMTESELRLFSNLQERMFDALDPDTNVSVLDEKTRREYLKRLKDEKGLSSIKAAAKDPEYLSFIDKAKGGANKEAYKKYVADLKRQGFTEVPSYESWLSGRYAATSQGTMGKAASKSGAKGKLAQAKDWVKKNPKLAAGIGAGAVLAGGAAAYAANKD